MARFNFRTLLDGKVYGVGFFEFPDNLLANSKAGFIINQANITAVGYSDPEVGNFDLSNLNDLLFATAATTGSIFNIMMSTPDRLKAITAGTALPDLLGPVAGKPIKLEWPVMDSAGIVQPTGGGFVEPMTKPFPLPPVEPVEKPLPPNPILVVDPVETAIFDFNNCTTDCFAQMGYETRCFVLETIKIEINNLINNSNFDLSKLTLVLNEIHEALDGDDGSTGLQAYVQLVNDIKFLMDNRLTQQNITNIINNTEISNHNITSLVNNNLFIDSVINNQNILTAFVNNTISKIINYLVNDTSTDIDINNQFIAAFNQLIIKQITLVKQEIDNSINLLQNHLNSQIQQINVEIININNAIKDSSNTYATKFELNNLQIQIDALKNHLNSFTSLEFNSNIDLSRNVTIINILSQITQINNSIADIKVNLQKYLTRDDFAYACETACRSFLTALRDPRPCKNIPPPEPEIVIPPIPVIPGAGIHGDPHFVGAEGGRYDVQGEVGKTYNLLSDQNLQVNGTFGEWNVDGQGTIIKEIGITNGNNFIKIGLQGALEINDKPVNSDGTYLDGSVTKAGNNVTLKSAEYELLITDNQVQGHHYLNIDFKSDNVAKDGILPHGLWGQTADGDGKVREGDKGHASQGGGAIEDIAGNITQTGDKEAIKSYEVNGLRDTSFTAHNKFSTKKTSKKNK